MLGRILYILSKVLRLTKTNLLYVVIRVLLETFLSQRQ